MFSKVRIHRNNMIYDLLLRICKIIIDATVINESDGSYIFKDFVRDEKAMARLFEAFIRNFYRKELTGFRVSSPRIDWDAISVENSDLNFLPEMRTDIVLENSTRKIVIDTKYYREIMSTYFESNTFHSSNLYQIYSYLKNLEVDKEDIRNAESEGLLLYPTVQREYDQSYIIGGHKIRFATVDLSKEWRVIDLRLKQLISK
jgi:5-methylcytosine-specific restriction enzyme subunit McrC